MKYRNTFNGHTYWISNNTVMMSNGEVTMKSNASVETFNEMIASGALVEIEVTRETFAELVKVEKSAAPQYQIRFLAFLAHKGAEVWKGNVAVRNARFMKWISERKADYVRLNGHMIQKNYCAGDETIIDQQHFTDFIVSGEWL